MEDLGGWLTDRLLALVALVGLPAFGWLTWIAVLAVGLWAILKLWEK